MRSSTIALAVVVLLSTSVMANEFPGKTTGEIIRVLKQKGILAADGSYSGGSSTPTAAVDQVLASSGSGIASAFSASPTLTSLFLRGNLKLTSTGAMGWASSSDPTAALRTTLSQNGAGVLQIGGASADASGTLLCATSTLAAGTLTTSNPSLSISQTWNAGGVTFNSAKINITQTACATESPALAFQQAGTTYTAFTFDSANWGKLVFYNGGATTHIYCNGGALGVRGDNGINLTCGGSTPVSINANFLQPAADAAYDLGQAGNAWRNLVMSGTIKMGGTTASSTVAPTWTNFPGVNTAAQNPYTWLTFKAADGTAVYVPAFK